MGPGTKFHARKPSTEETQPRIAAARKDVPRPNSLSYIRLNPRIKHHLAAFFTFLGDFSVRCAHFGTPLRSLYIGDRWAASLLSYCRRFQSLTDAAV